MTRKHIYKPLDNYQRTYEPPFYRKNIHEQLTPIDFTRKKNGLDRNLKNVTYDMKILMGQV
jgi:hypothetical protein